MLRRACIGVLRLVQICCAGILAYSFVMVVMVRRIGPSTREDGFGNHVFRDESSAGYYLHLLPIGIAVMLIAGFSEKVIAWLRRSGAPLK
jgi:hypothetical protein